jgi:hypothetical protein
VAYAAHERRKNKRRNYHLDQAQKDVGDNGEIARYRNRGGRIRQEAMEYETN